MIATATIFAGQVLRVLASLMVLRALSFQLSLADLGLLLAAIGLVTPLARLLDLGLPNAAVFFLRKNRWGVMGYAKTGALALAVALAVVAVAHGLATPHLFEPDIAAFLSAQTGLLLAIIALEYVILFATSAALARSIYSGVAVLTCAGPIFVLGQLWLFATETRGAADALVLYAQAAGITALIGLGLLGWLGRRDPTVTDPATPRQIAGYATSAYGSGTLKVLSQRADRMMMIAFLAPSVYALYAIALTVRDALLLPGNAFAAYIRNRFTDAQGAPLRLYAAACLAAFGVLLAAALVFNQLAGWFLALFLAPGFDAALPVLSWLSLSIAPLAVFAISQSFLYALPALWDVLFLNFAAAVSLLGALYVLGTRDAELVQIGQVILSWSMVLGAVSVPVCAAAARRKTQKGARV